MLPTSGTLELCPQIASWILVFTETTNDDYLHSDRNLCPSSSSEDNVQCCVGDAHSGLKRRQDLDNFDLYDSPTSDSNIALPEDFSTTPNTKIALAGDVSTSADTLGALPITSNTIVPTVDTSTEIASATPNTNVALGGSTSTGSSNFNLAQIDNYSQNVRHLSPGGSHSADEGLSVGLNHGISPVVTYTNGGGSTFSLGPTTSVTSMLENLGNLGSSFSGIQGGINIGFRKLKRSLADALN